MKLFSSTRARRNTAFMVLLAWLFAVASGVANACLLEAREAHSLIAATASSEATHAPVILLGHAGAVADGRDESHFNADCLKVCDDSSRFSPKQDSTVAHVDPGPTLPILVLGTTMALVVPKTLIQIDDEQSVRPELPIRVRFSRLAI